jgi:alkylation response protein AidB-like acyl-CoA dehydrogenase
MISRSEIKTLINKEPAFDDIMLSLRATGKQPKGIINETKKVIAIARKFNEEVTIPGSLELDRKMHEDHDHLAWDYVQKAAEWGFYTMFLPKLFGGQGYSMSSMGFFLEEIASRCLAIANIIGVHYLGVTKVSSSWNIKIADRLLRDVVEGEKNGKPCLLSLAMTEPDAGTDSQNVEFMNTGNLRCHARKVDGGYVINGTKIFISMGHMSTWHLVHVYTDLNKAAENTVMLAVKTGDKGFSFGKIEKKMGQKGSVASELIFNDCFVPDENVCVDNTQIAKLNRCCRDTNAQIFAYIWGASRMGVGSFGTGAARGGYEMALRFACENELDGRRMVDYEWCQSMLAEMYKNVALARLAYTEANYANGLDGLMKILNHKPVYYMMKYLPVGLINGMNKWANAKPLNTWLMRKINFDMQTDAEIDRVDGWGSLAKVAGTDAGVANCRMALEIMGKAGVRQDHWAEKMLRDAKLLQIYEGTNQINRINLFKRLIARNCPGAKVFTDQSI